MCYTNRDSNNTKRTTRGNIRYCFFTSPHANSFEVLCWQVRSSNRSSAFATIVGFALISAVSFVEPTPSDLPTYDAKLNYLASGCDDCLRLDVLDAIALLHPIELLSTASALGQTNRAGGGSGWHDGAFVSPALWHDLVTAFCRRGGDDGAKTP